MRACLSHVCMAASSRLPGHVYMALGSAGMCNGSFGRGITVGVSGPRCPRFGTECRRLAGPGDVTPATSLTTAIATAAPPARPASGWAGSRGGVCLDC